MITFEDFETVEMRVGRIISVEDFKEAKKPAYKLKIDFGKYGVKNSSAQVTHYTKEELMNRLVIAVLNFPPKRIAGFDSEVLVLGVPDENNKPILLKPDREVPLGGRVY
jgi:tRNA-binding protein